MSKMLSGPATRVLVRAIHAAERRAATSKGSLTAHPCLPKVQARHPVGVCITTTGREFPRPAILPCLLMSTPAVMVRYSTVKETVQI